MTMDSSLVYQTIKYQDLDKQAAYMMDMFVVRLAGRLTYLTKIWQPTMLENNNKQYMSWEQHFASSRSVIPLKIAPFD